LPGFDLLVLLLVLVVPVVVLVVLVELVVFVGIVGIAVEVAIQLVVKRTGMHCRRAPYEAGSAGLAFSRLGGG
jgi:hypothetical protein